MTYVTYIYILRVHVSTTHHIKSPLKHSCAHLLLLNATAFLNCLTKDFLVMPLPKPLVSVLVLYPTFVLNIVHHFPSLLVVDPIGHFWHHLKTRLGDYERPPSGIAELWERIQKEWELFQHLCVRI